MSVEKAASHYDGVTEVWRKWVMGEDLHFGLFSAKTDSLAEATHRLTERLAAAAQLAPDLEVLDVGCGVGNQALYLATEHGCRVTGISTSRVGLDVARERAAEAGLGDHVRFELADATDNGLPDDTYDRIWSLESTHLMPDKEALFSECFRVLKPGGRLALCDVTLVGKLTGVGAQIEGYRLLGHSREASIRIREAVRGTMHRAFGTASLVHVSAYEEAATAAGFADVQIEDISRETRPTLERWGKNADDHYHEIEAALGRSYLDDLYLAILNMSFGWGRQGGYVVMTATKQ